MIGYPPFIPPTVEPVEKTRYCKKCDVQWHSGPVEPCWCCGEHPTAVVITSPLTRSTSDPSSTPET